jgi:hypothetical protein
LPTFSRTRFATMEGRHEPPGRNEMLGDHQIQRAVAVGDPIRNGRVWPNSTLRRPLGSIYRQRRERPHLLWKQPQLPRKRSFAGSVASVNCLIHKDLVDTGLVQSLSLLRYSHTSCSGRSPATINQGHIACIQHRVCDTTAWESHEISGANRISAVVNSRRTNAGKNVDALFSIEMP